MKQLQIECTGIKEQVIREIIDFAKKYQIKKVILFGSRARGNYHTKSDIDLAVLGENFTEFALAVDEETSTLLEYDFIDLSGEVSEALLESIKKEGVLIYEKI